MFFQIWLRQAAAWHSKTHRLLSSKQKVHSLMKTRLFIFSLLLNIGLPLYGLVANAGPSLQGTTPPDAHSVYLPLVNNFTQAPSTAASTQTASGTASAVPTDTPSVTPLPQLRRIHQGRPLPLKHQRHLRPQVRLRRNRFVTMTPTTVTVFPHKTLHRRVRLVSRAGRFRCP